MKIAYVLGVFPKLSETFILTEILELIKRGNEIVIFSLSKPQRSIIYPEVFEYRLMEKTIYPQFFSNLFLKLIKPSSFKLMKYRQKGVKAKLYYICCVQHFAEIIRKLRPEVIHAHFATGPAFVAMLLSKLSGVPYTFTAHAYDIFKNPDVLALKERISNSSATLTVSHYNKKYLSKLTNIPENKFHVIRACPNLNRLNLIKREEEEFKILTVARLVEKKGVKYAIMAMKNLVKDFPKLEYRIVGSGPLEKELKDLTKSLGLERHIRFLGELTWTELSREYAKSSLFVLPSVRASDGDMDGIPVSLMEAMYLRIPVISTNISGIPELIENGKEGLLVDPADVEQLTKAIRILLENDTLRKKMGNAGRRKIEEEFNIHKEADKLLKVFKKLK